MYRPLHPKEKIPVHVASEVGWTPEQVWKSRRREKSLAPTGIRTSDRPVRSLLTIPPTLFELHKANLGFVNLF